MAFGDVMGVTGTQLRALLENNDAIVTLSFPDALPDPVNPPLDPNDESLDVAWSVELGEGTDAVRYWSRTTDQTLNELSLIHI